MSDLVGTQIVGFIMHSLIYHSATATVDLQVIAFYLLYLSPPYLVDVSRMATLLGTSHLVDYWMATLLGTSHLVDYWMATLLETSHLVDYRIPDGYLVGN